MQLQLNVSRDSLLYSCSTCVEFDELSKVGISQVDISPADSCGHTIGPELSISIIIVSIISIISGQLNY